MEAEGAQEFTHFTNPLPVIPGVDPIRVAPPNYHKIGIAHGSKNVVVVLRTDSFPERKTV